MSRSSGSDHRVGQLPTVTAPAPRGADADVDDSIAIRSLRRRLWRALQEEDAAEALRCYRATRADWERAVRLEQEEEEQERLFQQQQQQQQQRQQLEEEQLQRQQRSLGGKRGSWKGRLFQRSSTSRSNSKEQQPPIPHDGGGDRKDVLAEQRAMMVHASAEPQQPQPTTTATTTTATATATPQYALLATHMHPSEPFQPDDYKDPLRDPYDDDDEEPVVVESTTRAEGGGPPLLVRDGRKGSGRLRRSEPRVRQAFSLRRMLQRHRRRSASAAATGQLTADPSTSHDGDDETETDALIAALAASPNDNDNNNDNARAMMTTPLHEAARLGGADLLQHLLELPGADCSARNGAGRTALHCVAGGLTAQEAARGCGGSSTATTTAKNSRNNNNNNNGVDDEELALVVGIRAPQPPTLDGDAANDVDDGGDAAFDKKKGAVAIAKAARIVGRLFRECNKPVTVNHGGALHDERKQMDFGASNDGGDEDDEQKARLEQERCKAAIAILAWSSQKGNDVSQGVSTNAVDRVLGRTALHYAAELGRGAICDAILQAYFGTLLTVIDGNGRTPCELAAARGADQLAARLEARALLYMDPYGTDEEMLEAVISSTTTDEEGAGVLAPPFSWFQTYDMASMREKREHRLARATEKMQQIVETLREREITDKAIEEHARQITNKDGKPVTPDPPGEEDGLLIDSDSLSTDTASLGYDVPAQIPVSTEDLVLDSSSFSSLHEGHVEHFLRFHSFDVKKALDAFCKDPFTSFREANIALPLCTKNEDPENIRDDARLCLICCEEFDAVSNEWRSLSCCDHGFCRGCLATYLEQCAAEKSTGMVVPCPHHACCSLLSPSEIADISKSEDTFTELKNTANEQFVVDAHDFKFCPHPGCPGAVKFQAPNFVKATEKDKSEILQLAGAVCTATSDAALDDSCRDDFLDSNATTYEGVKDARYFDLLSPDQPRKAHRFCFQCGESQIHWPVPCDRLNEWKDTIAKQVGTVDTGTMDGDVKGRKSVDEVAQKLWMKANTRPCPKCKAPIQKNEGCNHMICSNPHCKHEFCWICRNNWKLHNSETGGFFRCNRWVEESEHESYDDENPPVRAAAAAASSSPAILFGSFEEAFTGSRGMASTYGTAEHETRAARKRSKEMGRFLHHYQRWHAHAESAALERQMAETVCSRLAPVVREVIDFSGSEYAFGGKGLSFIHAAFTELLECRSLLQHSYAFSFLRYKSSSSLSYSRLTRQLYSEKMAFEQTQSSLELMVEQISDVVARSHIRATQTQIAFLTAVTAEKRKDFSNVIINALVQEKKEASQKNNKQRQGSSSSRQLEGGALAAHELLESIVGVGVGDEVSSESDASGLHDGNVRDAFASYLAAVSSSNGLLDYSSDDEAISDWACVACTYVNAGGRRCEMCGSPRFN